MVQLFLILESILFLGASSWHFGFFAKGHEHAKARIAEAIIGLVLLIGFILSLVNPEHQQTVALEVQAFALLGTFIGIFTIMVGVGPRTRPDIIMHIIMIALLVGGIALVW